MAQNRFQAAGASDTTALRKATNNALEDLVKQLNAELVAVRARLAALEEASYV